MGVLTREHRFYSVQVTLSPAGVAPNTSAEQTFTVTGVTSTDLIFVNKPTAQAGLVLGGVRASASNQIGMTFGNLTAATITPTASQVYELFVFRPEVKAGVVNA